MYHLQLVLEIFLRTVRPFLTDAKYSLIAQLGISK